MINLLNFLIQLFQVLSKTNLYLEPSCNPFFLDSVAYSLKLLLSGFFMYHVLTGSHTICKFDKKKKTPICPNFALPSFWIWTKVKRKMTLEMVMSSFTDDLWTEILLRLPIKSLLQFKLVSESWFSIILSYRFAISHLKTAPKDDEIFIAHHELFYGLKVHSAF